MAGIYASKTKKDSQQRYIFKRKLMMQILQKFTINHKKTRMYLSALFYFIDFLLQVPEELKKKLSEDIRPLLGKEASQQMRAEKEKLPPTIAELFADSKEEGKAEGKAEGKVEGIEEAKKMFAKELIRDSFPDEYIAKLTKLNIEAVKELRKEQ